MTARATAAWFSTRSRIAFIGTIASSAGVSVCTL